MAEDWQNGGFGLYVHWPFCEAKCPYCDFNSHVTSFIDQDRWHAAYLHELRRVRDDIGPRVLKSIFFGGGTPSLMEPGTVAAVIDAATEHWTPANDLEITLEANPGSVERAKFHGFAEAGVNRVSMGVQALNDPDLRQLGRLHSVEDAQRAFDIARDVFTRVSFDLIYARQNQTLDAWQDELGRAMEMAIDHLSLYQLTIEPGTAFGDRHARGGLKGLPSDDLGADMYDATQTMCNSQGFPAYEVSNHAGVGAESRHNLIYWTYGDYAGIGPGAHGRITMGRSRYATESHMAPGAWLSAAEAGCGYSMQEPLSGSDQAAEFLLMGLRLHQGISLRRYDALAGAPLPPTAMASLTEDGLIEIEGDTLRTTSQGMPLLNHVLNRLLT